MQEKKSKIAVRFEDIADIPDIYQVNRMAFGRPDEANLVDRLRKDCPSFFSLVAVWDETIVVGHVLFTPARIQFEDGAELEGMALGPLAVLPEVQSRGAGSALCKAGLEALAENNTPFVIVLGHPQYYPQFGFETAHLYHIRCSYPNVPPEAFMIRIFQPELFSGLSGVAYYRSEFDDVT